MCNQDEYFNKNIDPIIVNINIKLHGESQCPRNVIKLSDNVLLTTHDSVVCLDNLLHIYFDGI